MDRIEVTAWVTIKMKKKLAMAVTLTSHWMIALPVSIMSSIIAVIRDAEMYQGILIASSRAKEKLMEMLKVKLKFTLKLCPCSLYCRAAILEE